MRHLLEFSDLPPKLKRKDTIQGLEFELTPVTTIYVRRVALLQIYGQFELEYRNSIKLFF